MALAAAAAAGGAASSSAPPQAAGTAEEARPSPQRLEQALAAMQPTPEFAQLWQAYPDHAAAALRQVDDAQRAGTSMTASQVQAWFLELVGAAVI